MNYAAEFPQCANCPFIQRMQTERDTFTETAEQCELDALGTIIETEQGDAMVALAEQDTLYIYILDLVERGIVDPNDPRLEVLLSEYRKMTEQTDTIARMRDTLAESLGDVIVHAQEEVSTRDRKATIAAQSCGGPRATLFMHRNACNSPARSALSKLLDR